MFLNSSFLYVVVHLLHVWRMIDFQKLARFYDSNLVINYSNRVWTVNQARQFISMLGKISQIFDVEVF